MKFAIVLLFVIACTDDDEPPPIPTCDEIGAPENLFCNAQGLCSWEGMTCKRETPDGGVP